MPSHFNTVAFSCVKGESSSPWKSFKNQIHFPICAVSDLLSSSQLGSLSQTHAQTQCCCAWGSQPCLGNVSIFKTLHYIHYKLD